MIVPLPMKYCLSCEASNASSHAGPLLVRSVWMCIASSALIQNTLLQGPARDLLFILLFLQFAHLPLGTSLADELDPVKPYRLSLAVSLLYVDDQRRRLLELDVAKANVDGAIGVPVFRFKIYYLRRLAVIGLAEVHIL